jgi:hypothetical protein
VRGWEAWWLGHWGCLLIGGGVRGLLPELSLVGGNVGMDWIGSWAGRNMRGPVDLPLAWAEARRELENCFTKNCVLSFPCTVGICEVSTWHKGLYVLKHYTSRSNSRRSTRSSLSLNIQQRLRNNKMIHAHLVQRPPVQSDLLRTPNNKT